MHMLKTAFGLLKTDDDNLNVNTINCSIWTI